MNWSDDWLQLSNHLIFGRPLLVWDSRDNVPRVVVVGEGMRLREENGRAYDWSNHYYSHWALLEPPPGVRG